MAMRFTDLKVGDQLVMEPRENWHRKIPIFWIVTDLWFDPVAGQHTRASGMMAAVQRINDDGELFGSKRSHTLRGLASQGFTFARKDIVAERRLRAVALKNGSVVGIGQAYAIRRRPKTPGL
jgi:hypothetical protein